MAPPTDPTALVMLLKLPECSGPETCLTLQEEKSPTVASALLRLMQWSGSLCPMCPRHLKTSALIRVPEPASDA